MHLSKRATIVATVLAMSAVGVPAFAGKGGGGGGGGNPGTKPYDEFKGGGMFTVTEGTANAVIQVERVPKGADVVNFSTNGSPNGAVGAADCSDPATDYVVVSNATVTIGTNGVGVATVPICNNSYFENQELVNLLLSQHTPGGSPVGGKITGTLTINDNDKAPVLSVNNKTGAEGTTQTFTVTASAANPLLPMSFHWATSDGTAKSADGDYNPVTQQGNGSIAPGATTTTIDVTSLSDDVFEPGTDEYFWVTLSAPVNSSVSSTAGSGKDTIQDTTSAPTFAIADGSSNEGNSGQTGESFAVSMSRASSAAITVHWSTSAISNAKGWNIGDARNDCAHNASDGTDLISDVGTVTFPASSSAPANQNITVQLCGDTDFEPNELFVVELDSPTYGSFSDFSAVGTIVNDDTDFGGFESGLAGWTPYSTGDAPGGADSTAQANSGTHSAFLGGTDGCSCSEPNGLSGIYRDVAVPASGTTTLSFYVMELGDGNNCCGGTDTLYAEVWDPSTETVLPGGGIFNDADATSGWINKTFDLTPFAGTTVRLIWLVSQDGLGAPSGMYLDDVTVTTV